MSLPPNLTPETLWSCIETFGGPLQEPFWIYDAQTIHQRVADLAAFDTVRYAQKACSNLHILRLMREQGVVVDAVSWGEIERALRAGFRAAPQPNGRCEIVYTADVFDEATLLRVVELGLPVNAGSIDMLEQLGPRSPGHPVWLRINPGFGHGHSQKTNTGGEHSKHGIWHEALPQALGRVKQLGLNLQGLHMHIGSGVDYAHLSRVCEAMVDAVKLAADLGHDLHRISAGGGLSIPYRSGQARIDPTHYFGLWHEARQRIEQRLGHSVELEIEPGRYLVAESGALLAPVRAVKDQGQQHFVLINAGFSDLVRPAMYGGYHGIALLHAPGTPSASERPTLPCVVAGPLCESGDVFTQAEGGDITPRELPSPQVGDWLVFEDAGAYGASMSSNYNSRPLIAEVMLEAQAPRLIRQRQSLDSLLALENP